MSFIVTCKACGLTFEICNGRDGRVCTCPRCYAQGRLKAVDEDEWTLEAASARGNED